MDPTVELTLAVLEEHEEEVLHGLLDSQNDQVTVSIQGMTATAARAQKDDDRALLVQASPTLQVSIPPEALDREEAVVVVTEFNEAAVSRFEDYYDNSEDATDGPVDVEALVSISLFSSEGERLEVTNLARPINFTLPLPQGVADRDSLLCGVWDEELHLWSLDGLVQLGVQRDALHCATYHLSLFGAISFGYVDAFKCSQASLATADGIHGIWSHSWAHTVSAFVLWMILACLLGLLMAACLLDVWRASQENAWTDWNFFVFQHDEPNHDVDVEDAAVATRQDVKKLPCCCVLLPLTHRETLVEVVKTVKTDIMDEILASFVPHLDTLRQCCAGLWALMTAALWKRWERRSSHASKDESKRNSMDSMIEPVEDDVESDLDSRVCVVHKPTGALQSLMEALARVAIAHVAHLNACAANFVHCDDKYAEAVGILSVPLDGATKELPDPEASSTRPGLSIGTPSLKPCLSSSSSTDIMEASTGAGSSFAKELESRSLRTTAWSNSSSELITTPQTTPLSLQMSSEASSYHLSSKMLSPQHVDMGSASMLNLAVRPPSLSAPPLLMTQREDSGSLPLSMALTSASLHKFHSDHTRRLEQEWAGVHRCSRHLRGLFLRFFVHGPIGTVFVFSMGSPSRLRAMALLCDLLGALAVATFFMSVSGKSRSVENPPECDAGKDFGEQMGRFLALGMVSAFLAKLPVFLIFKLHSRDFKVVAHPGCKDHIVKLRAWRLLDFILWTLSTLYAGFCALYITSFFANVSVVDHKLWMASAGMAFLSDLVLAPLATIILPPCVIVLCITLLAAHTGKSRMDIVERLRAEGGQCSVCNDETLGDRDDKANDTMRHEDSKCFSIQSHSIESIVFSAAHSLTEDNTLRGFVGPHSLGQQSWLKHGMTCHSGDWQEPLVPGQAIDVEPAATLPTGHSHEDVVHCDLASSAPDDVAASEV